MLVDRIIIFFLIFTNYAEIASVKILKGSMYLVETGLLESRLDLHTFIREYMVLKISNGWFWFHKTFSEYDSAAQRRVIMPSLGDVVRGCTTGRFAIEDLVKKPFGEDNEVSLLLLYYSFHLLRYCVVGRPIRGNQYPCNFDLHWFLLR